jgi:hypothetical protein
MGYRKHRDRSLFWMTDTTIKQPSNPKQRTFLKTTTLKGNERTLFRSWLITSASNACFTVHCHMDTSVWYNMMLSEYSLFFLIAGSDSKCPGRQALLHCSFWFRYRSQHIISTGGTTCPTLAGWESKSCTRRAVGGEVLLWFSLEI